MVTAVIIILGLAAVIDGRPLVQGKRWWELMVYSFIIITALVMISVGTRIESFKVIEPVSKIFRPLGVAVLTFLRQY